MPSIVPPPTNPQDDDEQFCPECFAGIESSQHHQACIRPTEVLGDIAVALLSIYEPAGALMFWSSRIKYLDDKRPCDVWADRNMVMLERLAQRVNALADGAFA